MKPFSWTAFVLVVATAVVLPNGLAAQAAQTPPAKPHNMMDMSGHHDMNAISGWKELDAFHALLAAAWHPAEKSNDLKPVREKATALSEAADKWAASTVPSACDTKKIRDAIKDVAAKSKDVAKLVATEAKDSEVKKALGDMHTRFEAAESGCHLGGK